MGLLKKGYLVVLPVIHWAARATIIPFMCLPPGGRGREREGEGEERKEKGKGKGKIVRGKGIRKKEKGKRGRGRGKRPAGNILRPLYILRLHPARLN